MDDQASKENPSKDFNKLDLTQLQGFSFGTQWTQDKSGGRSGGERTEDQRREGDERPRRQGGEARRDRRGFRKPAAGEGSGTTDSGSEGQRRDDRAPRRDFREGGGAAGGENRGPRRDFQSGGQGQRREGGRPGPGGEYRGGPRGGYQGNREGGYEQQQRGPYISPFYNVTFYPEDTGFTALAKAIRSSCRTYELFEIARVVVGKNDRFVASIQRKQPEQPRGPRAAAQGQGATAEAAPQEAAKPGKPAPFAISVPDGLPFDNEEAVVAHVMSKHLGVFFDSAEVEIEAPKGNYLVINRCGLTGELLGPPNYHLYNQIVQQHYTTRISRMPFEAYRARIETVRDPEVVKQWLEKMTKTTRYTWKLTPPAEGAQPISFDSLDDARSYLLANARDKVVRLVETARLHGKLVESLPQGDLRRAIESTLERQRRFPLDTANGLRGRLRREGFTIFKKGSKGISYVCAVKRKFRVPGQTFSDSIGALIAFIEANPMVKASELPLKFLNIQPPATPETAPATPETAPAATAPAEEKPQEATAEATPASADAPVAETSATTPPIAPATTGSISPFAATTLSAEDNAKLHRLNGDLRWLVAEGYVTEFIDGRLFAPPAMTEVRKQEIEKDEHDPENFPEVPAASTTETPAPEADSAAENAPEPQAEVEATPAQEPEAETPPQSDPERANSN